MILFLVTSIPIFFFGITTFLNSNRDSSTIPIKAFFKGFLWFWPAILLYLLLMSFFPISYNPFGFYVYFLLNDHLLHLILVIGGYLLFYGIPDYRNIKEKIFELFAFLAGYFTLISLFDFISNYNHFGGYILFMLPLIRMATILLVSLLLMKFLFEIGMLRFFYLSLLIIIPFIANIITVAYMGNQIIISILLILAYVIGSGLCFYFLRES